MVRLRVGIGLLCLLLASTSAAQEQRGSIEGTVKDSSGALVPGATVEARSPALVGVATTVSDAQGAFRFPALPPGLYEVSGMLQGFAPAKVDQIALELGQILKLNLTLGMSAVAETVSVRAESPLIDVKQNAATLSIPRDVIERIPSGRNFPSVITSAPGVNDESRGGGPMIDGASASENRWVVDGVDTTTIRTGISNKELRLDFVEQVQVKQSGYNAEFRAATGGVVSAVTRNGSNAYHGSVGMYYRADNLMGSVRPTLRLNPIDQTRSEYVTTRPADFQNYEPVLSIGGPIIRDRAWFFAGFVPQINDQQRTVRFTQNGLTDRFESRAREYDGNFNVTGQIARNLRGKFSGILERTRGAIGLPKSRHGSGSRSTSPAITSGRRTAAGGCSTTSRRPTCRVASSARNIRSLTTTRSTRSTGRRSSAAIRLSEARAAPARTSSRSTIATRRTRARTI